MIVILEGPDGAGKSTLARQLVEQGFRLHHEGPPPDSDLLQYYGRLLQRARVLEHDWVFDRFAFGERVYGPILRDLDRLGAHGWRMFRRLIWASGAVQVFCMPPFATCGHNWAAKHLAGEDLISKPETFRKIYERYAALIAQEPRVDVVMYDYERDPFPRDLVRPMLPPIMVGHPRAPFLFVGKKNEDPDKLDLPFFDTDDTSKYFCDALAHAGIPEDQCAFINAVAATQQAPAYNDIPTTFRKVVALGYRAWQTCNANGIDAAWIDHPQYHRNFKFEVKHYAYILSEATR